MPWRWACPTEVRAGVQVIDFELQRQLAPYMRDLHPLPGVFDPDFIAANQGARADHLVKGSKQVGWHELEGRSGLICRAPLCALIFFASRQVRRAAANPSSASRAASSSAACFLDRSVRAHQPASMPTRAPSAVQCR